MWILQVDELLKSREKIQESFTAAPPAPKKVPSSGNVKGVGDDSSVKEGSPVEAAEFPTEDPTADKGNKKKWFGLNFKTGVGSTGSAGK